MGVLLPETFLARLRTNNLMPEISNNSNQRIPENAPITSIQRFVSAHINKYRYRQPLVTQLCNHVEKIVSHVSPPILNILQNFTNVKPQ